MSSPTEAELDCLRRIDVLVLTAVELDARRCEELLNLTYTLYLECGRQIAPAFQTRERLAPPLRAGIEVDGRRLWPSPAATVAS